MIVYILKNLDQRQLKNSEQNHMYDYVCRLRFYIKDASRVLIYTHDHFFFTCAFLAALSLNKTILFPHMNKDHIKKSLIKNNDLILDDSVFNHLPTKRYALNDIDICNPTLIFYTSGTTGNPKAIIKKFSQLEAEALTLKNTFSIDESCFVSTVPMHHIYGFLFSVLLPLYSYSSCLYKKSIALDDFLSFKDQTLILISNPTQLKRIEHIHHEKFKIIFSSSAPLPYDAAQNCLQYLRVLPFEIYGSTETGGIAYRQQHTVSTPWKLFNNIKINTHLDGTLTVESPYLLKPETINDVLLFHSQNEFDLLKRKDRTVKIEGKRINLDDIEGHLLKHPFLTDVRTCVIDLDFRLIVGAVLVLSDRGKNILKKDLIRILKQDLTNYYDAIFIPRKWRIVDHIPKNEMGKYEDLILKKYFDEEN
ncbi:MAG: 2-succinylbenzoate--CoA ligase [Holosporales bacterium]